MVLYFKPGTLFLNSTPGVVIAKVFIQESHQLYLGSIPYTNLYKKRRQNDSFQYILNFIFLTWHLNNKYQLKSNLSNMNYYKNLWK